MMSVMMMMAMMRMMRMLKNDDDDNEKQGRRKKGYFTAGWHKLCNPASQALRIFFLPIYEDF